MNDFKGRHFPGEIVLWAVRWYCRYGISYRDLETMMTERGTSVHSILDYPGAPYILVLSYKRVIGPGLRSRILDTQKTEAMMGVDVLNHMSSLGRPVTERIG